MNNRPQTVFSTAGGHHVNGCEIRDRRSRIKPFLCDAIISSFSSSYCYVMAGGKAGKHLAGDRKEEMTRGSKFGRKIKKGFHSSARNILRGERSNLFLEAFEKIDCLAAGNQYLTIKEKLSQKWRKSAQFRVFSCAKKLCGVSDFLLEEQGWRRIPTCLCYTYTVL